MGWTSLIGAALGAFTAGAAALKARAEQKKQNQLLMDSQRQQQQQMAQQAAAIKPAVQASVIPAAAQTAASVSPAYQPETSNVLRGLGTIATSPLGDTSEPVLGRRKLLGN